MRHKSVVTFQCTKKQADTLLESVECYRLLKLKIGDKKGADYIRQLLSTLMVKYRKSLFEQKD